MGHPFSESPQNGESWDSSDYSLHWLFGKLSFSHLGMTLARHYWMWRCYSDVLHRKIGWFLCSKADLYLWGFGNLAYRESIGTSCLRYHTNELIWTNMCIYPNISFHIQLQGLSRLGRGWTISRVSFSSQSSSLSFIPAFLVALVFTLAACFLMRKFKSLPSPNEERSEYPGSPSDAPNFWTIIFPPFVRQCGIFLHHSIWDHPPKKNS